MESFTSITSLQELYLADNQIVSVPNSIGQLKGLRVLNLARNQISTVPNELGNLSQITWISLSGNNIETLPSSFVSLFDLQECYLACNKITALGLPKSFNGYKKLKVLDLSSNQIDFLPGELGFLTTLLILEVANNPLLYPPRKYATASTETIKNYLKSNRAPSLQPQEKLSDHERSKINN